MRCAAKALGCEADATQEIMIGGEWHPMCNEHVDLARKMAAESALRIGNVAMVYTPPTRPL